MKLYLLFYMFGNEVEKLKTMLPPASKIGHVNNSQDLSEAKPAISPKG